MVLEKMKVFLWLVKCGKIGFKTLLSLSGPLVYSWALTFFFAEQTHFQALFPSFNVLKTPFTHFKVILNLRRPLIARRPEAVCLWLIRPCSLSCKGQSMTLQTLWSQIWQKYDFTNLEVNFFTVTNDLSERQYGLAQEDALAHDALVLDREQDVGRRSVRVLRQQQVKRFVKSIKKYKI